MHTAELEYVFQTVKRDGVSLTPQDVRLADVVSSYWVNFAKAGDPNGPGLPPWPQYNATSAHAVMHLIGDTSRAVPEDDRARYQFIEAHAVKPK